MKNTGWLIAGVTLAALIYLQVCRTPKPIKPGSTYDALRKETEDTIKYYEQLLKANDAATELAVSKAEDAFKYQLQAEDALKAGNNKIAELIEKNKQLRKDVKPSGDSSPPTGFLLVPSEYVFTCDSIALAAGEQSLEAGVLFKANDSLRYVSSLASSSYKNAILVQKQFNNALRAQLDTCQSKLKKAESAPVKRSQLYGGINLMGNRTYFIDGGQVNLTLLTKRNTMFEINAGLIHGETYIGAGAKFLLSFRRK